MGGFATKVPKSAYFGSRMKKAKNIFSCSSYLYSLPKNPMPFYIPLNKQNKQYEK